jgi:hypothetical protein
MDIIEIQTLIDITNTRVIRPNQGSQLELDQNRNFITLLQCIELRSLVEYDRGPIVSKVDIKTLDFGSAYKGKHAVWTFRFTTDRSNAYMDETGNNIGTLLADLHQIPVIKNLKETLNIETAIFDLESSEHRNTVIKSVQGII